MEPYSSVHWPYDVFISHTGPIKYLALELEHDLRTLGFEAFADKNALHPGDDANQRMVESARTAPIWLVLFSEDFVVREWRLAELKLIVEAGTLLPVAVGMSHTELKAAWRGNPEMAGLSENVFQTFARTTFVVEDRGDWHRPLRERVCFVVLRVFVEKVCARLPDTAAGMLYVERASSAAHRIAVQFGNITPRDHEAAMGFVKHLGYLSSGVVPLGTLPLSIAYTRNIESSMESEQEAERVLWVAYSSLKPAALKDMFVLIAGMWPNTSEFREYDSLVRSLAAALFGDEQDGNVRLEAARGGLNSLVDSGLIQFAGQSDSPWLRVHDALKMTAVRAVEESTRFCRLNNWASASRFLELGASEAEHLVIELAPSEDHLPEDFFATISRIKSCVLIGGPGGHIQLPKLLKPGLIGCRLLSTGWAQIGAQRRRLKKELPDLQCLNGQLIDQAGQLVELGTLLQTALSSNGVANLSDRSLDSFPLQAWRQLPEACGKLRHLTLDDNDLRSLPAAVGQLVSLEFLSVENNLLIELPAELAALTGLKTLRLACNRLEVFPAAVRGMVSLQSLFLSGNKLLKELPDWFPRSCPRLKELDVSSCAFSSLPSGLLDADELETLALGGAPAGVPRFTVSPEVEERVAQSGLASSLKVLSLARLGLLDSSLGWVGALRSLQSLDLRGNQLVSLPRFIADMRNLSELQLVGNEVLVTPPREVAQRGLASIRAFLDEMSTDPLVRRTLVRLMFVGWESAGKTKLSFALQGRLAEYSGKSTFGIDTSSWEPDWVDEKSPRVTLRSWDFAGQQSYYALHRFFLTERALYLFIVDLSPEDFEKSVAENVRFWLDSLNKHTRGAIVQVVGTKVDRILERYGAADGPAKIERRRTMLWKHIADEEARVVKALKKMQGEFEGARIALDTRPTLPRSRDDILLCSLPQEVVPRELAEEEELLVDEVGGKNLTAAWGDGEAPRAVAKNAGSREKAVSDSEAVARPVPKPSGSAIRQKAALEPANTRAVASGSPYDSALLLAQLRSKVLEIATAPDSRFHLSMPPSYVTLMEEVEKRKLRCRRRDEACSASEAGGQRGPREGEVRSGTEELGSCDMGGNGGGAGLHGSEAADGAKETDWSEYLSWEAYREIMLRTCEFNGEENLKEATRLLHDLGVLLWYDGRPDCPGLGEKVLLRPERVLDLLTPIVGHELDEQFALGGADRDEQAGRTNDLIKALERKGILFHDLLDFLPAIRNLSKEGSRAPTDELKQYVLYLLRSFGLAYPSRDGSFDYVPLRCQAQTPADLFAVGFPCALEAADPQPAQLFGKRVRFTFGVPEGFAENVIVSLQTQLVGHFGEKGLPCIVQQWRHGTLFQACVRPVRAAKSLSAAKDPSAARIRILLWVPPARPVRDVFELVWMLSEAGEAGSSDFVVSEALAAHVNRWLSLFLEEKVVGLVSEVFCPYLVPVYEELVRRTGQILGAEPATNRELGGHTGSGSLEEVPLQGAYKWQGDKKLRGRAQQLSMRSGGSAQDNSRGDDERRKAESSQEWELVPDELLTVREGRLNLSFTRLGARQAVYFSHFFSGLVELNVSNASLRKMHVDLRPNRQLKILNAGFNDIGDIGLMDNWLLPESVQSLFLYRNGFTNVPARVSGLASIANFNGDGNELVTFPTLPTRIRTVSLSHNKISFLPDPLLQDFSELSLLDLKENSLTNLPPEITGLTALEQLLLSQNELESLPSEVGSLPKLRTLDVSHNRLRTLPPTVGQLDRLEKLFVGHQSADVQAKGPAGHAGESTDASLKPASGSVAFALPGELDGDGLKSLRVLACQSNGLGPSLPVWVLRLRTLVELDVGDNKLEFLPDNESVPSGNIASSSWSWLTAHGVGRDQQDSRLALPALEILCLSRNRLRRFPGWVGESRQCRVIEANGNLLEQIPVEFHRLHRLEVLDLRGNQELGFDKAVQEGPPAVRRACRLKLVRARAFSLSAPFLIALLALLIASSLPRALGQGEASQTAPCAVGRSALRLPVDLLLVGLLFLLGLLVRLWKALGWVAFRVPRASRGAACKATSNHLATSRDEEVERLHPKQPGSAFPANDPKLHSALTKSPSVPLAPVRICESSESLSVKPLICTSKVAVVERSGSVELVSLEIDGEDEGSAVENSVGSGVGGRTHKPGKVVDSPTTASAGGRDGTPVAWDEEARGEETLPLIPDYGVQAARRLPAPARSGGAPVDTQPHTEPQHPEKGHAGAFATVEEDDGIRVAVANALTLLDGETTRSSSGREVAKRFTRFGKAPSPTPETRALSEDASGSAYRRAKFGAAPQWRPAGFAALALRLGFLLLLALLPGTFAASSPSAAPVLRTAETAQVEIFWSSGAGDIHLFLTPAQLLILVLVLATFLALTSVGLVLLVRNWLQPASLAPHISAPSDPGKTIGPNYVQAFTWEIRPDQKPVCPKLHKDDERQRKAEARVQQEAERNGAVTVYSTCTVDHTPNLTDGHTGQPMKVVTVALKVYSQHHLLPELTGDDKGKDHGFYQEELRVKLRPEAPSGYTKCPAVPNSDDFQRQVDKTVKKAGGGELNGVLEFTPKPPFAKLSVGGKLTSTSENTTATKETQQPIFVTEHGAVENRQEFNWCIRLDEEHERSALLANGKVKRKLTRPNQGPIGQDFCTNLTASWRVKDSEEDMRLKVEVERTLKYVKIMENRWVWSAYLKPKTTDGVVENGIARVRWGPFEAGPSQDMQVKLS